MHRRKTRPYSEKEYNRIIEEFQTQKIKSLSKDKLIAELINQESWIYDYYLRSSCSNLFLRTGGFISTGLTIDDLFKIGIHLTINQINKNYFFDLQNDNNILILQKIKSRIVNNIKNYFSPTRKINFRQFQNIYYPRIEYYDTFEKIITDIDLEKINKKIIKNGLRKVWDDAMGDMDFDQHDFDELCSKFGFLPLDLLLYDPYIVPQMTTIAANNREYQLVLVFDLEVS